MTRLSATDALFAYVHTEQVPMNMGTVQFLTLPPDYQGDFVEDFKHFLAERLDYLPRLKKRLVVDAVGLPCWTDVDDFDLDYHIRRSRVRSSDPLELARKLGRLQHKPFDFDKPLFMFYVVEGLEEGRIALVQKFHHTIADGKTAVRMMDLFTDEGLARTELSTDSELDDGLTGNRIGRAITGAVEDLRRSWRSLPGLVGAGRRILSNDGRAMLERVASRPVTIFNQQLSEKRLFAFRHWPLADLQQVRKAADLTFNDMGLVLLGGALRRYLDELDVLPDQSLVCNVPVALEAAADAGNAVLAMWVPMGTHLEDRRERITFVKRETSEWKRFLEQVLEGADVGAGIQLPSLAVRLMALPLGSSWIARQNPPPGNVSLSNVPTPAEHIHVAGARVDSLYGIPMLLQSQALGATFSSYADKVVCGLLCCAQALPDPERVLDYMEEELQVLRKTYLKSKPSAGGRRPTRSGKTRPRAKSSRAGRGKK